MKQMFVYVLAIVASLFTMCNPDDGYNPPLGPDNPNQGEEPIPVPKPEEPEPEVPEPEVPAEAGAPLTAGECADCSEGYNTPNNYTNSYGTWVICAY